MPNLVFSRSVLFLVISKYWDKNQTFCPTRIDSVPDISYLCIGSINKKCRYGKH